jgi:hypothetical protein
LPNSNVSHKGGLKMKVFTKYDDLKTSLVYFLISLFVIIAYLPLFQNIDFLGIQDFDYNFFTLSVSIDAMKKFGEMPLMNFFDQGGVPLLATPFSHSLSPFNLLYFIFDYILALKVEILLHALVGTIGMFHLLKDYKFRNDISLIGSMVFGLNSYHALNIAQGQYEFLPAFFIPLVILSLRKKQFISFVLLLTLMFLGGGVYLLAMLGVVLALICLFSGGWKATLDNIKFIVLGAFTTACLSAIKLLPSLEYMSRYPRTIDDISGFSLSSLLHSLVNSEQIVYKSHDVTVFQNFMKKMVNITDTPSLLTGMDYGWDENGMYIGWFFFACVIFSFIYHSFKKTYLKEASLSLIILLITFGDRLSPSVWGFLKLFPPFESMRHSTRFRIYFIIFICVLIAAILEKLVLQRTKAIRLALVLAITSLSLITMGRVSFNILSNSFVIEPILKNRADKFHYVKTWTEDKSYAESHEQGYYPAYLNNKGVSFSKENHSMRVSVLNKEDPTYKGEVYSKEGEAQILVRTSSTLEVQADQAGKYIINHNFLEGWRCEPECSILEENGLLSFSIKKKGRVKLSYDPLSFKIGLFLSLLTILFLIALKKTSLNKPFEKFIKVGIK